MSIKLADYDFVRHFSNRDPDDTDSMTVVGTWKYRAPEIDTAHGEKKSNTHYIWSADIFSLGVICFELYKGKQLGREAGMLH